MNKTISDLMATCTTSWCQAAADLAALGVDVKSAPHRYGDPGRPLFFVRGSQVFSADQAEAKLRAP